MVKNTHAGNEETLSVNDGTNNEIALCLEVEMDDEVKEIISSPEKCGSTLLDVTLVKPRHKDKLYSTRKRTLSGNEVRKLFASLNLDNYKKVKLIDQILSKKEQNFISAGDSSKVINPRQNYKNFEKKCEYNLGDNIFFENLKKKYSTEDTTSEIHSHRKVKQIYTTPKTFHELNSIFSCKNKNIQEFNEKPENPCLCQNCAVVGVVNDSQKKPFATEKFYDPRDPQRKEAKTEQRKKKDVNFKDIDHSECQYYLKYLSDKIKHLEARLAIQEERAVSKDYFKRIVTKLVSRIAKLTTTNSEIRISKESKRQKDNNRDQDNQQRKYRVQPVFVNQKVIKTPAEKENAPTMRNPSSSNNPSQPGWKWGEDILRPGVDLKNKIVSLMEDTFNNFKCSKDKYTDRDAAELSSHCKNTHEVPERDSKHHGKKEYGSHEAKKKKKQLTLQMLNDGKYTYEEPINVSYMNPQLKKWQDSLTSCRLESSDAETGKYSDFMKVNELYKLEFLKTIFNTNEEDKLKLWNSIWAQAVANGQSKNDKVTIQLPDKKDPKDSRNTEILYTIGDLETLLVGRINSRYKMSYG